MQSRVFAGTILVLFAPLIGAYAGAGFRSSRANQAADRYARSVKDAAEDFDKRVRGARESFIRELKLAESAASRTGDDTDARRIRERRERLTQMQEVPTQLPKPLVSPGVALVGSQFVVTTKETWHFEKDGLVYTSLNGAKVAEGQWKQLGTHSVTARFKGFYAIAFDSEYKQCIIRAESKELRGKRVN